MSVPFILLIMNCEKYRYKAEKQKDTWLKDIQIPYYHVLGNENLESEYKFDDNSKTLWVKTPDDYISLPKKVVLAYKAILKVHSPSYIFKTDDDQLLISQDSKKFMNTMFNIINTKTPKVHYAGNIVNVVQPYLSKYHTIHPELPENLPVFSTKYCSGRFYILSSDAIYDLILKREKMFKEYLEDYAVGFLLNDSFKETIMHIDTNKYFIDM